MLCNSKLYYVKQTKLIDGSKSLFMQPKHQQKMHTVVVYAAKMHTFFCSVIVSKSLLCANVLLNLFLGGTICHEQGIQWNWIARCSIDCF
jgi:hypothetical protein